MSDVIRAAGGVVWRLNDRGEVEVLLVHRSGGSDWTFPKGKVARGESEVACALREVEEETALRCTLEEELGTITYRNGNRKKKMVRYWRMRPLGGEARPQWEIDAVRWVSLPTAMALLTYPADRDLLDGLRSRLP
jgi:8-oxo-dGTP diphosphatase